MQNSVFVLDTNKQPLSPCRPSVARKLLRDGKAAVYRRFPFTIILKRAVELAEPVPAITVKVDPGSKTTGIALVQDGKVVFAAELEHRGQAIKDALESRRAIRRGRRQRNTRYRQARFLNRTRPKGWSRRLFLPAKTKAFIPERLPFVRRGVLQSYFRKEKSMGSTKDTASEFMRKMGTPTVTESTA